jgi:hypothetical protein
MKFRQFYLIRSRHFSRARIHAPPGINKIRVFDTLTVISILVLFRIFICLVLCLNPLHEKIK